MKPWRFWGRPKTMALAMIILVGAADLEWLAPAKRCFRTTHMLR